MTGRAHRDTAEAAMAAADYLLTRPAGRGRWASAAKALAAALSADGPAVEAVVLGRFVAVLREEGGYPVLASAWGRTAAVAWRGCLEDFVRSAQRYAPERLRGASSPEELELRLSVAGEALP